MIWSDFKDEVRVLLTVDAQRKGAGIQSYIDSVILSGVIELQQYMPTLRAMNRDVINVDLLKETRDIELSGLSQGSTKGKGKITKAVILKPQADSVLSIELTRWPYDKRNSLKADCQKDCRSARFPGKIMQRPGSNNFYLYPGLSEEELLILDWEGVKTDYEAADETPYDRRVVKVVSDYTKAHIVREVDKDLQLYSEYWGTYVKERAVLFLDEKDSTLFDMPSISEGHYSTCCIKQDTLNRATSRPEAPAFTGFFLSPDGKPSEFKLVGFTPDAPTAFAIGNCRQTAYSPCSILSSEVQVAPFPTDLKAEQVGEAPHYILKPDGLHAVDGVATPPSDLVAIIKPFAPTGFAYDIAQPPARPTQFEFLGLVPNAPTGFAVQPTAPSDLQATRTSNPATTVPNAPWGLDYAPLAPTQFSGILSNASGTIEAPYAPDEFVAIHDGVGGEWTPEAPSGIIVDVSDHAPTAPSDLNALTSKLLLVRYEFDGTKFVRKEYYLMEIDINDGGNLIIEDF